MGVLVGVVVWLLLLGLWDELGTLARRVRGHRGCKAHCRVIHISAATPELADEAHDYFKKMVEDAVFVAVVAGGMREDDR